MVRPRVLIIDDEKNIRKTLGLVLGGENYDVVAFGTAEEGLKYLENEGADLIILDVKLPGMTGIEVITQLTKRELERAITNPGAAVGVDFEPDLVAEIVSEVANQPGTLPMLQYALTELFDHNPRYSTNMINLLTFSLTIIPYNPYRN